MKNVKLVTCNGVKFDLPLLEHHIRHYLNSGILPENYLLILNSLDKTSEEIIEAKDIASKYNITNIFHWIGEYSSEEMHRTRKNVIRNHTKDNDWVVHCDADEFHWYYSPLESIIKSAEQLSFNCVQGVFTDRVSSSGELSEINREEPIYNQFPILANLNDVWFSLGSNPPTGVVKMMIYKRNLVTSRGGHVIQTGKAKYAGGMDLSRHKYIMDTTFRENCMYQVHHFKWHSGVVDKLKRRIKTYKSRGFKWWKTSQKFVNYFEENGKIALDTVELYDDQTNTSPIF